MGRNTLMVSKPNFLEKLSRKTITWYCTLAISSLVFLYMLPLNIVRTTDFDTNLIPFDIALSFLLGLNLFFKKSVTKNYLIPLIFVAILPYELVAYGFRDSLSIEALTFIRCFAFLKLTIFSQFLPLISMLKKQIKFSVIIIAISLGIHCITCGWIYINGSVDADFATTYNKALYWSTATLTTVGYGDITPQTNSARLFTIFVMLCGVTTFGLILSHFFQMILLKDKYTKHKNRANG